MNLREIIALSYLVIVILGLWFLTVRSIILDVRKNRRDRMSEYITDQSNNNKCDNEPKPDRMSNTEIIKLHKCPDKKSQSQYGYNKSPTPVRASLFAHIFNCIIKRVKSLCQPK